MQFRLKTFIAMAGMLSAAAVAAAQSSVVDLGVNSTQREVWRGETAGSRAGLFLDRGDVSAGDSRRDLIVGAPGWNSGTGRVYVLFGGAVRRGDNSLSLADVIVTGGAAGDQFGTATAAGYISAREVDMPTRDLVVGAPGANSNAGKVYMYLRGLVNGQRLGVADARITITGAPAGARLGTALATGDLDGDGYREMIIGAPGINAVYVVKGGPTVTGTIDLSVPSSAFFRIQGGSGSLVGRSLASGDVTGDLIYDLAVGALGDGGTAGAVYLIRGRTSNTFPAVMTLPTDADAAFSGIDAADYAGQSLDIAPFDGDDTSDVIIGAPNASGPGNARPQGGEIYVIWGSPTIASRSLASADVTIYGAAAYQYEGADVATGDADRHPPYDLVSLAPGASAGGDLHLILGRPRSAFPKVIDLGTTPPDRRYIGPTSGGARLVSTLIYDLTGEGVEDVVGGVPDDNQGVVYVSFSPVFEATLSYPLPGATDVNPNHPFQWAPLDNADMYRLTIGTATGRNDIFDSGDTPATSVIVTGIPYNRTVYARLYTRIAAVWRSRDSSLRAPSPASMTFPVQGLSGVRPGTFSWTSLPGSDAYRLMLGSTLGGREYLDTGDLSGTTFNVFSMPTGSTVYARLFTKLAGYYEWLDISFTTAPAGLSADSPSRGMGVNFGGAAGGDVFLYNPGSGTWSLQLATGAGFDAVNSGLWASGWTIKPGDFNGDGLSDLFLYRQSVGDWYMAINVGGGNFVFYGGTWRTGWNVYVEDFNADGRSDVFLYNPTTGLWYKALTTAAGEFDYSISGTWAAGWSIYPADFNGDGRGDLFLYNRNAAPDPHSGVWYRAITQSNGSFSYDGGSWTPDYDVVPGDYNGDGLTDLFIYRPATGDYSRVRFASNGTVLSENGRWAAGWTIRRGDFNADGLADLFLYNATSGVWYMVLTGRDGSPQYASGTWRGGWDISVTDLDADGRADLLLYNSSTGVVYQALTRGHGLFDYIAGNFGANWTLISTRTITP